MAISGPLTRREFVAMASVAPGLLLAPSILRAEPELAPRPSVMNASKQKVPLGLELYAVRTELARDLPGTLRQVARIGYEAVEFYAPYFDWTPAYARDVRRQLDDLGLQCRSTHNHLGSFQGQGLARASELNSILGSRQIILASAPHEVQGVDDWKRLAETLSAAADRFAASDQRAGFHNHQAEWARIDGGQRILDLVAANTPSSFVLQLDVGTCLEAGQDPVAWIRAHPGRIRSVHLKDWAPGNAADEKGYRVLFGEGAAPWPAILEAAETVGGVEVYLMEQEGSRFSEFETAERSLANWKALRRGA